MKKIVSLLLALAVIISCCGCNSTTVSTDTESWVEGGSSTVETENGNAESNVSDGNNDANVNNSGTNNSGTDNNGTDKNGTDSTANNNNSNSNSTVNDSSNGNNTNTNNTNSNSANNNNTNNSTNKNDNNNNNNNTNNSTNKNDNNNNNNNQNNNSNSVINNPLDVDLKGATIKIYQGNAAFSSFLVKEANTKTLKSYDEILKNIQNKLNCKFEVVSVTEEKLKSQVMASAASGNALCNIITTRMTNVGYYVSAGVLADMTRISSMDLSKSYMNNLNMLNASELGGSKYAVCSENGLRAWVTLYNKRILKELGYKDNYLYDLAKNKKFNWSNAKVLANKALKDLDGKSGMSSEDQWGFLTVDETWPIINTIISSGSSLLKHDKAGYLSYNMKDSKIASSVNYIYNMYTKEGLFSRKISNWEDRIASFADGHSLFITMTLEHLKTVTAKSADDFGLLPLPMADGANEYKTVLDWNADAIVIPAGQSANDQYNSGAVVQALLSECGKNKTVLINEYTNRYLCDDESAVNMQVAIDATKADVSSFYCNTNEGILSGTYRPIWDLIGGKISSVATRVSETESSTVAAIKEFNDRAKKNKS